MKPVIWYEIEVGPEYTDRLAPFADVIIGGDVFALSNVQAIVIGSLINANGEYMDRLGPEIKAIFRHGIGVDNVDIPAATERGILVIHTPDAPSESTAEHAVALLLATAKRVVTGSRFLQNGGFPRDELLGVELRGKTLGVVGYGRIGRRVAEICGLGLGMEVIVYDPFIITSRNSGIEFAENLDDLLARADFITLHTPLVEATRGLIGPEQFAKMKPGAYLINASRGPVVNEIALIHALQDGHLAGAGLDVFDPEPPAADNPLLHMNNAVCTPHVAAFTDQGVYLSRSGVVDQLIQILKGERPKHLVNADAWPGRLGETTAGA